MGVRRCQVTFEDYSTHWVSEVPCVAPDTEVDRAISAAVEHFMSDEGSEGEDVCVGACEWSDEFL